VDGYTPEAAGMNITNTHIPAVITVSGIKTWNDEDDVDGIRPPEIIVHLLADGTDTGSYAVVTPADDGTWTYAFADVDQYANGKEIVYTVSEDAVEGYTTIVDGMNITNTHTRPATPLTPPERPDTPKTPDTVRRPSTPNTGDETNAPLFAGMMGTALLAAAVAFLLRKKYTN
jgi:LPXTG-motif cell wall-anchored protein